jgi:hypothetical protein
MSDNLYEPHPAMIDSGTFWRCAHGSTGWYACWRCGLWHPFRFLKHLFEVKEIL